MTWDALRAAHEPRGDVWKMVVSVGVCTRPKCWDISIGQFLLWTNTQFDLETSAPGLTKKEMKQHAFLFSAVVSFDPPISRFLDFSGGLAVGSHGWAMGKAF